MIRIIRNQLILIITLTLAPFYSWSKTTSEQPIQEASYYQELTDDDYFEDDDFETYESTNATAIYDPFEKYNRKIYAFNDVFDRYFLEHVARTYRVLPKPARTSVRNFLTNLSLPVSALNSFAQGRTDNGLATLSNFLINSTVGIIGIFDVAGEKGIGYQKEDFGQTLGHYGSKSGAYLMIPLFGPSSTRDFSGWIIDKTIDPLGFNMAQIGNKTNLVDDEYQFGLVVATGIDTRESLIDVLDGIRQDSFDPYATIRSAYLQKRDTEVKY